MLVQAAEIYQRPPGRPPAAFDPIRRALWEADSRAARHEGQRKRRLNESPETSQRREDRQAATVRVEANKLQLRVYALAEPGLPRLEFSSIITAAKHLKVHENAVRTAIRNGWCCRGRRLWWTSRPIPDGHFEKHRRYVGRYSVLMVGDIEYSGLRVFAQQIGVCYESARRYLVRGYCLMNGRKIPMKYVTKYTQKMGGGIA